MFGNTFTIVLIIIGIVFSIWLYKMLKPYIIKYNTTIFITGELGAGKTLTAVKLAVTLIRKNRMKVAFYNKVKRNIINKIRSFKNWLHRKDFNYTKIKMLKKKRKPQLITNIPVYYKTHFYTRKKNREWSIQLDIKQLVLLRKIPEGSVVLIDELPQLVDQFTWDEPIVQENINEFITFFRHYIAGNLIITAQAVNDVVVQIRRKCNQAIWCYNMKKHLFGLFYTIRIADMMLNDSIQSMSTTYIEDNTKRHFGLFPPKNTYDTRCFSERYNNVLEDPKNYKRWDKLKTNEIIRVRKYTSPLDDNTSEQFKKQLKDKVEKL